LFNNTIKLINWCYFTDPESLDLVNEVAQQIKDQFNYVIGKTFVRLSNSECRDKECNLGNVIADAFVSFYIESTRKYKLSWTSTPIALVNGGAVRTSINVGNITMEDIMSTSPFGNKVGILKANGSLLWQILEHSGSQYKMGGFMQVSGLRIDYDLSQPNGHRLRKVRVRCADCLIPDYEDIDPSKTYAIVINEYIVFGGDNYTMIDPTDFRTGDDLDYDILSMYVKRYSPIITGNEDRILFSSDGSPNFASSNQINASFMIKLFVVLTIYMNVYKN
jgi:5'-nucleotidase